MRGCIAAIMFGIVARMSEATSGVLCFISYIASLMRATAGATEDGVKAAKRRPIPIIANAARQAIVPQRKCGLR